MREAETAMITGIKKDIRWKEWEEQIRECRSSGLTAVEWCKQNNINVKTYYYHLIRVRERLCEEHTQDIVSVSLPEKRYSEEIRIEKNGLQISLLSDISADTLAALVHELC